MTQYTVIGLLFRSGRLIGVPKDDIHHVRGFICGPGAGEHDRAWGWKFDPDLGWWTFPTSRVAFEGTQPSSGCVLLHMTANGYHVRGELWERPHKFLLGPRPVGGPDHRISVSTADEIPHNVVAFYAERARAKTAQAKAEQDARIAHDREKIQKGEGIIGHEALKELLSESGCDWEWGGIEPDGAFGTAYVAEKGLAYRLRVPPTGGGFKVEDAFAALAAAKAAAGGGKKA